MVDGRQPTFILGRSRRPVSAFEPTAQGGYEVGVLGVFGLCVVVVVVAAAAAAVVVVAAAAAAAALP